MKTNELREKYLAFFETKGCVRKASDVLVPKWDPSVLFTPAGMNQFKDHFLGRCKLEFTRATTCQKCLRTGDIDNVGRTAYHHTFFEMLGNFSFGDYFKKEAIAWAWEFLTDKKWLGIDKQKLSVTVYKDDEEAAELWRTMVGVPSNRISYCEEDENFWPASAPSLGPDGVCGPCSEIYYDTPLGTVEIWNLVFTQFNREGNPPNNLRPLPSKNIDTGMGLERCAAVLQNVETNYHIDILRPLVEEAAAVCHQKYDPEKEIGRRFRRIADHVRACTFAVHENVYPGSKEERYVIRRLLRRAVLDGWQLGIKKPFLHLLVPKVAELMKVPYPEISETIERVSKVISSEEEHFLGTIDGGMSKIEKIFTEMKGRNGNKVSGSVGGRPHGATAPNKNPLPLGAGGSTRSPSAIVSGSDAFEMYQTFGFPPELFETMATEQNIGFDWDGFHKEMERHGEISGSAEKNLLFKHDPLENIKQNHKSEFVGYLETESDSKVVAILADGKLVDSVPEGQTVQVILDRTPFYGEKGGQVGDKGTINGWWKPGYTAPAFVVENTQIDGDLIVHIGHQCAPEESDGIPKITLKVGDDAFPHLGQANRQAIARAHTATHLLHNTLRKNLGAHAEQQGSKVDEDLLRFDFTNHEAIPKEILAKIETDVNEMILEASSVSCHEMPIEDAKKVGAMMLFGEKYPEHVRVVVMGESKELCGGTHLKNTSQVGLFRIIAEESVSAGTRRITAVTGLAALRKSQEEGEIVQRLAGSLRIPAAEIPTRVEALADTVKKLRKQLETQMKHGKLSIDDIIAGAQEVGEIKFISAAINDAKPNELREWIDQIRSKTQSVAIILAGKLEDDKVSLIAGLSRDLVAEKKLDAVAMIKVAATAIGGSGGGRPDMAQAGGKGHDKVFEAFTAAKKWLEF